jgi:predicted PurR-regulated permease PerM
MQVTEVRTWLWLAGFVIVAVLLYLLAPVLTPFLVGALLAYLGDPLVDRLERFRISRTLAVLTVFACMLLAGLALLLILAPLVQQQIVNLIERIPDMLIWMQDRLLPRLNRMLGVELQAFDPESLRDALGRHWRDVGNVVSVILGKVGASGQILFSWLAWLLLVPVVTFYLLRDWDVLVEQLRGLVPRRWEPATTALVRECDDVLAAFLRGQLLVMLALGLIYSVGLWLAGLEFALLIGMFAGLVSFVPYLGSIVGILVAGVVALIQFQDVVHIVFVLAVFGVGQAIEGMVLSPWLVGERIGMHPVGVIFAVMAGGQLFGFFGVLVALPVAAILTVLLRHAHARWLESDLYTP